MAKAPGGGGGALNSTFNEQQRLISLQQSEIDQLRFETAIMEKETAKLRGIFQKRGMGRALEGL